MLHKSDKPIQILVIGAGNVGYHLIHILAGILAGLLRSIWKPNWAIKVVDFDTVDERCLEKGLYHSKYLSQYKCHALQREIEERYGTEVSAMFNFIVSDIRSVPGLIAGADVIFSGVDSNVIAAFISILCVNQLEFRVSTGIFGNPGRAVYTVEVCPPGITLADVFSKETWQDIALATRHSCATGELVNSFASVRQPYGALAASMAVALFQAADPGKKNGYQMVRITGDKVTQSHGRWYGQPVPTLEIPFSYDHRLGDLFDAFAAVAEVAAKDIRLRFCAPLVRRICPEGHGDYIGFERYPVEIQRCEVCGRPTYLETSLREVAREDLYDLGVHDLTLRALNAPAGLVFFGCTKNGEVIRALLPFAESDIPSKQGCNKGEEYANCTQ